MHAGWLDLVVILEILSQPLWAHQCNCLFQLLRCNGERHHHMLDICLLAATRCFSCLSLRCWLSVECHSLAHFYPEVWQVKPYSSALPNTWWASQVFLWPVSVTWATNYGVQTSPRTGCLLYTLLWMHLTYEKNKVLQWFCLILQKLWTLWGKCHYLHFINGVHRNKFAYSDPSLVLVFLWILGWTNYNFCTSA